MTRVVNLSCSMSSRPGMRSPTTRSTSSRTRAANSGCWANRWNVHVSTAAVVSCPAMSIVMRSSRSCGGVGGSVGGSVRGQMGRARLCNACDPCAVLLGNALFHGWCCETLDGPFPTCA
eukprot:259816-Chlamydomonas_euryale.AAC.1